MDRPHFIIIGAMKCATSTLHEQLARQGGIHMSTPKEPNFFSNDEQWARGPGWYAALFDAAGADDLCGESSTHYTKAPSYPDTVARMKSHLRDDVKLIYVMRHPVDRLVSHYVHDWTQGVLSVPIDVAVAGHRELVDNGRYAMQLEPYICAFGRASILPVFFERLSAHGQRELARICRHIGYRGEPRWIEDLEKQNVSSRRLRRSRVRDVLVNLPGSRALRRTLVPRAWRERIKGLWTMKQRPELSPALREQVEAVFDEDLARLGRWLGLELSCATFADVAAATEARWAGEAEGGDP